MIATLLSAIAASPWIRAALRYGAIALAVLLFLFSLRRSGERAGRLPASRMKGDLDRKEEVGGDHLVPLAPQAIEVLCAVWPLTGNGDLVFPSNRHQHRPMSENAIGYLLNRAGYHGHHVPHGFRAAFSTIMNEWAERNGKDLDRAIIDLMLAHVPKQKSDSEIAYNRAAFMPRRRELAAIWANMLSDGLPNPSILVERPAKAIGFHSRRKPFPSAACRL
ncbi:tyrosine-type recombinase/integrase [Sphingopyxis flava]|uniref:Phage integrase family protein n=1 Tax=Sphingopyxis flava TaxID=1507287 RepID=A0A1T5FZQ6_9SPHN|nr:hypothetical protein [Sphingopyxis flava]SKC01600.1 hypothetical protein SAMN06295937_10509 [Sphingopyxis flava]